MKAAIVINQSAGTAAPENEKLIREAFQKLNVKCEVFKFDPEKIPELINETENKGYDVLIPAGGDGTVSSIATFIAGTNKTMAVIPMGTLNHFAKDIGMPVDLAEAVKTIVAGKIKLLDVAEVNGRKFINNSSIGVYPHMVKKRKAEEKKLKTNKWVAMVIAMFKVLKNFLLYNLEICIDDKILKLRTPFVFVGNNKYKMELFNPGVRTHVDEGVLTLYTSRCMSRVCLLKLSFLSLFNLLDPTKDFQMEFVKEVSIEIKKKKKILVSADGEVISMDLPLEYKIHPQSLSVIVPAENNL